MEIALGAGICFNALTVQGSSDMDYLSKNNNFTLKKNNIGILSSIILDYYFSKDFSFQLGIAGKIIPKMYIPAMEITSPLTSANRETLNAHTINFSAFEISCGLCIHI